MFGSQEEALCRLIDQRENDQAVFDRLQTEWRKACGELVEPMCWGGAMVVYNRKYDAGVIQKLQKPQGRIS